MGYYYVINGVDNALPDNQESRTPSVLYDERILQANAANVIQRSSNLGSANPFKGPSPRTLFYDAGFRQPGKYGLFLMYAFGNGENDFMAAYYKSESSNYNTKISSTQSKNPSAAFLVNTSAALEASALSSTLNSYLSPSLGGDIVGGLAAPYNWKDFLYCKYYGTIPNNYMVTLRRYPTPMRDNLSLPDGIRDSDVSRRQGAGRPVAQAVTWMGGDTGNKLSDLLGFSSGLKFTPQTQKESLAQEAFDKGLWESLPINLVDAAKLLQDNGENGAKAQEILSLLALISDPNSTAERQQIAYTFRDAAETTTDGPLSEYIYNSVDTVDKMFTRGRGLEFSNEPFTIKCHYDLTSVGEVNTKAAMIDLMSSLLAIGTNYGKFLTPEVRYISGFPAINFPGGDAGLAEFYRNPAAFIKNYSNKIVPPSETGGSPETIGGGSSQVQNSLGLNGAGSLSVQQIQTQISEGSASPAIERIYNAGLQKTLLERVQMPLSFLTGAPTGEWHLVIGNPCNPIAMMGNLICTKVQIDFSDKLGPDDFPTEIIATFTLQHGRDRERGEIESMFNRGDGRLYETQLTTYSSGQSSGAFADTEGNTIDQNYAQRVTSGILPYTQSDADSQGPAVSP